LDLVLDLDLDLDLRRVPPRLSIDFFNFIISAGVKYISSGGVANILINFSRMPWRTWRSRSLLDKGLYNAEDATIFALSASGVVANLCDAFINFACRAERMSGRGDQTSLGFRLNGLAMGAHLGHIP